MRRKSDLLSKIALWALLCLVTACSGGGKSDVVALVPDIPTAVPEISGDVKLNLKSFPTLVEV
ncbi:MAG: hypothetical protein J6V00_00970, partial [Bacteroidaceae bacterium]|nr:hypothetical protein [Bacteroidaceae bacterium]